MESPQILVWLLPSRSSIVVEGSPCPASMHHSTSFVSGVRGVGGGPGRTHDIIHGYGTDGRPTHTMETDDVDPGQTLRRGQRSCFCPDLPHFPLP